MKILTSPEFNTVFPGMKVRGRKPSQPAGVDGVVGAFHITSYIGCSSTACRLKLLTAKVANRAPVESFVYPMKVTEILGRPGGGANWTHASRHNTAIMTTAMGIKAMRGKSKNRTTTVAFCYRYLFLALSASRPYISNIRATNPLRRKPGFHALPVFHDSLALRHTNCDDPLLRGVAGIVSGLQHD